MIDDVAVGQHLSGLAGNELHDAVFHLGQTHRLTVHRHHPLVKINGKAADGIHIGRAFGYRGAAAQHGPDASQQLGGGKGLGDIVIGTVVQCCHLVLLHVAGTDHDHRKVDLLPQLPEKLDAVDVGQSQIQQHHIGHMGKGVAAGHGAVLGGNDPVSVCRQQGFQHSGNILFVLNHQNGGFDMIHKFPPWAM